MLVNGFGEELDILVRCWYSGCLNEAEMYCNCEGKVQVFCFRHLELHLVGKKGKCRPVCNFIYVSEEVRGEVEKSCWKNIENCKKKGKKVKKAVEICKNVLEKVRKRAKFYVYGVDDFDENLAKKAVEDPKNLDLVIDQLIRKEKKEIIGRSEILDLVQKSEKKIIGIIEQRLENAFFIRNRHEICTQNPGGSREKEGIGDWEMEKKQWQEEKDQEIKRILKENQEIQEKIENIDGKLMKIQAKVDEFKNSLIKILRNQEEKTETLFSTSWTLQNSLNLLNNDLSQRINSLKASNSQVITSLNRILSTLTLEAPTPEDFSSICLIPEGSKSLFCVSPQSSSLKKFEILPEFPHGHGSWCRISKNQLFYYNFTNSGTFFQSKQHYFYIIDLVSCKILKQPIEIHGNSGCCPCVDSKLYIFGAIKLANYSNKAFTIDINTFTLTNLNDLPVPLIQISGFPLKSQIYFTGLHSDHIYIYDIPSGTYFSTGHLIENNYKIIFSCANRVFLLANDMIFEVFQGTLLKIHKTLPFHSKYLIADALSYKSSLFFLLNDNSLYKFSISSLNIEKIREITYV